MRSSFKDPLNVPVKNPCCSSMLKESIKGTFKAVLPVPVKRWIYEQLQRWDNHDHGRKRQVPVGQVNFGSLRKLRPIAPDFGWKWGKCIDRYYIDAFLNQYMSDIHGRVLEIQENGYTRRFGGARVRQSDVLHFVPGNANATIVADLTRADHVPSDTFDCIILTQTLQFIYDLRAALQTLYRILKPGGVLLATSHGISQIARYDMDNWGEYWRLTSLSARKIFTEVFPEECVTVHAYGNVLAAVAFLHGLTAEEVRRDELDYQDRDYEVLLGIRAVKPRLSD